MTVFVNTSTNKQIGKAAFFLYSFIFFPFSFHIIFQPGSSHNIGFGIPDLAGGNLVFLVTGTCLLLLQLL